MAFSRAVAMVVSIAPLLPAPFASNVTDDEDEARVREEGDSSLRGWRAPSAFSAPMHSRALSSFRSIRL
jgi:hypothetical protein